MDRRQSALLLAILVSAFGLRLAYAFLGSAEPSGAANWDGTWYHRVAQDIMAGEGVRTVRGRPTATFPPGYPAILAVLYSIFGTSYVVSRLLNCALATLSVFFSYSIATRAYSQRVGILAAALLAATPGDIFYASISMAEVTFTTAFMGCVWIFQKWNQTETRARRWTWLGVFLGLAALVRGISLFWAMVPTLIWLVRPATRRLAAPRTAFVALGLAIALAPWTIRNAVILGYPILIASDGPFALYIAHSETANGTQSDAVWDHRMKEHRKLHVKGRRVSEADVARADQAYALRYMLTHPKEELEQMPLRFYHLFRADHYALRNATVKEPDPILGGYGTKGVRLKRPDEYFELARFADHYFFALSGLAGLGLLLAFTPAWRRDHLVPLTLIFFVGMHTTLFWGDPRFHAPFVPMLCILAALTLETCWRLTAKHLLSGRVAVPGESPPPPPR